MNKINISFSRKTYEARDASYFNNISIDIDKLENILKSYNYSLIKWKIVKSRGEREYNRKRKIENFESASGIVIDIDEGLTIDEAERLLVQEKLNHIIITSKSHQVMKKDSPAQDRYHILVFFSKEVTDGNEYRKAFNYLNRIFPQMDDSCQDLARFIFASPDNAEYHSWFDGVNLNPDDIPERNFLNMPIAERKDVFEFDNEMEVRLGSGKVVRLIDIITKQPCHCVRYEHQDKNPSAIVSFNEKEDKWVIHCTGCKWTGWSKLTKTQYELNKQMQDFYYLGKDVYEMGIAEDNFFLTKNSEKNFCYTIGAESKDDQESAMKNLIKSRRLRTLTRIDYVGNPDTNESFYSVNGDGGIVTVNIGAIRADVIDNQFIESYLDTTFGKYKDFVKQYLAMYTFTNYTQLPTLVLYGPRGSSKTTFAGLVADIYPSLYMDWTGEPGSFTQECEKKLLIIEENLIDEKSQYKILKKYTGQDELLVNKKYQPEYMVRNNVNIILISNETIPLYVEKTEMPTDPTNNQFFVWEFKQLKTLTDGTYRNKLKERLGYYIRTELKTVFNGINKNYTRYGIQVPITTFETELFENNTTNIEAQADLVLEKIENRESTFLPDEEAYKLYRKGFLPVTLVEEYAKSGIHANTIIKNLKKRKKIENKATRKVQDKKKFTCYALK